MIRIPETQSPNPLTGFWLARKLDASHIRMDDMDTITIRMPHAKANDRRKAGQPASERVTFGPEDRFAVQAFHQTLPWLAWIILDSEDVDGAGNPRVRAQFDWEHEARAEVRQLAAS